jgi:UDP-N-acetylglucosamine 2-epimerase (non-hydrolysing)
LMKKRKIISVVGARPNFVKIAPLVREFRKYKEIDHVLVHTGQHYTERMSDIFFKEFRMQRNVDLDIGPASQVKQMAGIMERFEKVVLKERPDLVIVVGDVTSTLACALTAVKLGVKVAHIEAGLRSFDRTMPEEINRTLTDAVSDYLFVTEPSGVRNLKKEGIPDNKIFFVGNIMIDSVAFSIKEAEKRSICRDLGLKKGAYALLTLHRPSNVDDKRRLEGIVKILGGIREKVKIVYPVHPRSVKMLKAFGCWKRLKEDPDMVMTDPLGYLDFIKLMMDAKFVMTDSGGIQEETTYLGIPCFTLRENTERPVTVTRGTNRIVGDDYSSLRRMISVIQPARKKKRPRLWDGRTASRITRILMRSVAG